MTEPAPSAMSSSDPIPVEVVALPRAGQSRAVELLTLAFLEDPLYRALIPGADDRRRSLQALWSALITTANRYGVVDTTPDIAGIACWLAPGNVDLGLWPMVRTGLALPRAMMQFPADSRKRFLEMASVTDRIRRERVPQPHWYLWALGVEPERQGQGIGRSLLTDGLARADADACPCYLETETEFNVAFYSRWGFIVVHEGEIAGARIWSMLRKPMPSGRAPSVSE